MVDNGVLKTFLLGRAPLPAFSQSNGHGRASRATADVAAVESGGRASKTVTFDALMAG